MSEKLSLTDEQRASTVQRIIHDASLLQGGAEIAADGSLKATAEQKDKLYRENVLEPQLPEFMKTPDGKAIQEAKDVLGRLQSKLGSELGYAVIRSNLLNNTDDYTDWRDFSNKNRLGIDFDKLEAEATSGSASSASSKPYTAEIAHRDFITPLDTLALGLVEFPQYRIGNSVTVMRHGYDGNPNYMQDGWTVTGIIANGNLISGYSTPEVDIEKQVSIDELRAWNSPAQTQETQIAS